MSYERPNIQRMTGYTPGEQPRARDVVKLNTNENPYPPAAAVMDALRALDGEALRRYPSPTAATFRERAAALHGLTPEHVVATNGGDELLRLAITTFVEPGRPIGMAEPSYSLYPVLAAVHGSPVERVALDEHWQPPADFAERMNRAGVNLTFLVNPHAPSGTLLPPARIDAIAGALQGVLLVDEAYVDFTEPSEGHDVVSLVHDHDNLLILRTLSKGYSLAGLRFGYGLGDPGLISPIAGKTRDSYSVDAVAERLAAVALEQRAEAAESWNAVRHERERLRTALAERGLTAPVSATNFLLVHVPEGYGGGAAALHGALRERGIFVRHFDQPRLRECLRISIGTPEQHDALLAAMDEIASA
ncbi:histidinol-phosphate transaminase [Sediminicurvatus halobius]|uniref:Histidinol-phosphate aminotransferase n=1 Tax=Sediminicurvatus halobius TaxID=2182432 RepID=A0A2U2N028_9GAMM|nr:histidinol-phosphate transaminase [Spiribacter halobius]PWG62422.1 histidinol-phosphate transaminase [Spiribacter halobius]UEX79524.1 histidinol-phosphate transaminase [Spiribacter halobius]